MGSSRPLCAQGNIVSQDRLLAVAGVAKLFAAASRLTWAAGLWEEQMPQCLLWAADQPSSPCEHTYFPTWSWASVAGIVMWNNRYFYSTRRIARVIEVECKTLGDDAFGLLSSARIRLQAAPLEVLLDEERRVLGLFLGGETMIPSMVAPDRPDLPFSRYDTWPDRMDTTKLELRDQFVALMMDTHAQAQQNGWVEIYFHGLILEKCLHGAQSYPLSTMWRRAGYFESGERKVLHSSSILQSEMFSLSECNLFTSRQTHKPFNFDTATCL